MTRDDIIRLVQEAGIYYRGIEDEFFEADMEMMVKFAALVAAAEREACEKACKDLLAEIPLCGVTENYPGEYFHEDVFYAEGIDDCIEAIRARGEA